MRRFALLLAALLLFLAGTAQAGHTPDDRATGGTATLLSASAISRSAAARASAVVKAGPSGGRVEAGTGGMAALCL